MTALIEDPLKEPVTAVFAAIGLLFITLKIFSFWRLIASLFILPGTSVRHSMCFSGNKILTVTSSPSSVVKVAGLLSPVLPMVSARNMPCNLQQRVSTSSWSLAHSRSSRLWPLKSSQSTALFKPRLLLWTSPKTRTLTLLP